MKQLLIPVVIAILAGVGGGSGFAYMQSSKAFVADSIQRADSLKAHPPEKAKPTDSHSAPAPVVESVPMTPADSLRALEAARAAAHGAKGADTTHAAKPASEHSPTDKPGTDKPAAGHDSKSQPTVTPSSVAATANLAEMVRAARNEAMTTALPEQRLAKIFAAMSAKDAAKVMEQMPDADVRSILSLMSDRSAAAVLTQFAPARAATITNGPSRSPAKAVEKPAEKPIEKPTDKTVEKTSDKTPGKTP